MSRASNQTVADTFNHVAELLALQDANPFRVRAYRNAARTVEGLSEDVGAMIARGDDLTELPGIGKDLAGKIKEIVATGRLKLARSLDTAMPSGLSALLKLPGLGPKRVQLLHKELGIKSLADLRTALADGRVAGVSGFGPKSAERLRKALTTMTGAGQTGRIAWSKADPIARDLVTYLEGADGLTRVTVAGSYRRKRDTVGDLDLLATAPKSAAVVRRFVAYPDVGNVMAQGSTRAAVQLKNGLSVDLRLVPNVSFGAALHYFTGSKAHVIRLRRAAQKRGLKINEYGLFKGKRRIAGATEVSVYRALALPYIEPELREDRGDLHVHTSATDGTATIREMVDAARKAGLSYIAIADHSRRLRIAHGMDTQGFRKQIAQIDRLNEALKDFTVLKAAEVDISEDGTLDLPQSLLSDLDFAICAIHSALDLPKAKQTDRILRAMDNRECAILAHPTCRLIGGRDEIAIDLDRIVRAAGERKVVLEINCQPDRLDLNDIHIRHAKDEGVKMGISSDAHAPGQFSCLDLGVAQARRGWLCRDDVVNTRSVQALKRLLRPS